MLDRRQAIQRVSLLLGAAICQSTIATVIAGCSDQKRGAYTPRILSARQDELVACLAELIIPATDTPGAREAGVNVFIDLMLADIYTERQRRHFLEGLADIDMRARAHGSAFVSCSREEQTRILAELEALAAVELRREGARQASNDEVPFFRALKELTLIGYYTSEVGASRELKYVHGVGSYEADVPFEQVGRAYS